MTAVYEGMRWSMMRLSRVRFSGMRWVHYSGLAQLGCCAVLVIEAKQLIKFHGGPRAQGREPAARVHNTLGWTRRL